MEVLIEPEEVLAKSWNQRCFESTQKQKKEAEQRYGIRIGQTEIYCARCSKSWGFGKHTCQDVRLKRLNEAKKDVPLSQPEFAGLIASNVV